MEKLLDNLSAYIREIRNLCSRLDSIDLLIESNELNERILPEYIVERSRLNKELENILTNISCHKSAIYQSPDFI